MTFFYRRILTLLPIVLLGGCAAPVAVAPAPGPDVVIQRIDAAVANGVANQKIGFETPVARPVYSDEKTTVSFAGDASTLLGDAARQLKKGMLVTGPQPRLPIFVMVDVKDVTFESFLNQVASQLGQRADIELSETTIELKYR